MKLERQTFRAGETETDRPEAHYLPWLGRWLVEEGCRPPPEHRPARLLTNRLLTNLEIPCAMAITLRTATLLPLDLGPALIACVRSGCDDLPPLAELALHEILVNAAVHGNLEVSSGPASAWRDLSLRHQLIAAALDDPARAARLVTVALGWDTDHAVAAIIDQGRGYEPSAIGSMQPDGTRRAAGRGLKIARAAAQVDVLLGGRCTRLTFARHFRDIPV
jgi:hypothetical protein